MVAPAVTTRVHRDTVAVTVWVHRGAVPFPVVTGVHGDAVMSEVRKDDHRLRAAVRGDSHTEPWQPFALQGSPPRKGRSTATIFLGKESPTNRTDAPYFKP